MRVMSFWRLLGLLLSWLVGALDSSCLYSANGAGGFSHSTTVVKVGAVFTEEDVHKGVPAALQVMKTSFFFVEVKFFFMF